MQRSRSSTGIPIRNTNLFGAVKTDHNKPSLGGRERSRSTTRGSSFSINKRNPSLDKLTPLGKNFGSTLGSTSKQQGAQYNPKKSRTPSTPSIYSDYRRSTSSSSRPTFYNKASDANSATKILQKQINDKKWIAERYAKVQEFIHNSGLFDPQLATQIKPASIKTFVHIFRTLFDGVFPVAVNLNPQNYAEMTVQSLKQIGYPGTLTVSAVRTANTMHGWPNFIAMTSWLVEKVSLSSLNEDELALNIPEDCRIISNLISFSYNKWSQSEADATSVLSPEDVERFRDEFAFVLGVDYEADTRLSENIRSLTAKIEAYEELERTNCELKTEIQSKKDTVNEYNCDTGEKLANLDFKLKKFKKVLDEAKERNKILNKNVNNLTSQITSQSCTVKDKIKMLTEIENYRNDKERRRANIMEYYSIRDEMDQNYMSKISQLEKEVDAWNVVLTKTFLPEMEKLRLRDKGFHSHTFLEEIKERQKEQLLMQESFAEETERIKLEIEELEKRKKELIKTNGKVHDLLAQIKNLKKSQMEISEEMDKVKNQHEQNIRTIEDEAVAKFSEELNEIEANQKRLKELQEKFQHIAKEGLTSAAETHKYISEKLIECHHLTENLTDIKFNHSRNLKTVLRKKLEELQNLKTMLESVEQEWNEPLFAKEEEEESI